MVPRHVQYVSCSQPFWTSRGGRGDREGRRGGRGDREGRRGAREGGLPSGTPEDSYCRNTATSPRPSWCLKKAHAFLEVRSTA